MGSFFSREGLSRANAASGGGGEKGGKEVERGKRQRAVLTTSPSLPLLPSAQQGPTVRVTEAQTGFLEEQCLPSP